MHAQLTQAHLTAELWEPALGSVSQRDNEWLGFWSKQDPWSIEDRRRNSVALRYMGRDLHHRGTHFMLQRGYSRWAMGPAWCSGSPLMVITMGLV